MKILIEGTALMSDKPSGVGQYTKRLLEAMTKLAPKNEYSVFGFHFFTKKALPREWVKHPSLKYRYVRWLPGRGYNQLFKKGIRIPINLLLRQKPDITFFPNFVRWPLTGKGKSVIVIHDIAFEYFPQYIGAKNLIYLKKQVPRSLREADHIVAVSEYTKQDIMKHYGVSPAKISVVHPAIDHSDYYPRDHKTVAAARTTYKLPEQYILFVSTLEPRKNIIGLLDAYALLPQKLQQDFPLIFVGGKGWADTDLLARFEKYKNLPIRRLGYVPDEDMAAVYSGASLFVYPSFYEGFGMPVVEAMACGVPVITSNVSSLPEVVGDGAKLVDPKSTPSITKAMIEILENKTLQADLRAKGLAEAKKFTWETSAKNLLRVFSELTER